ncbi:MAG: hypothetical protein JJU24_14035 [Natronohydrobacter sp.]|nr:hypothetical protein [Natronohydrobacter sp.]
MLVLAAGAGQAQTPGDTHFALIDRMNATASPTLAEAVQIHAELRTAPGLEGLSRADRGQIQRASDRAQSGFFLRFIQTLEQALGQDGAPPAEIFAVILDPRFGPKDGLFSDTRYRGVVERMLARYVIGQAIAGQPPQTVRPFDPANTCPMIEARNIPGNERSLEAIFGLPFAFWDQRQIEDAATALRGCGPIGGQFAATLERSSRAIVQRAEAAQAALAWRAAVLQTAPTPAALAEIDWFAVPGRFDGKTVFPVDAQVIFGPEFQEAIQQIVGTTIEGVTARLSSGDIPLEELRNWCGRNIAAHPLSPYSRDVMDACAAQQRVQIAALTQQERADQAQEMLAGWQAAAERILAAPMTLEGARDVDWMMMPGTAGPIPTEMRDAFRAATQPVEAHALNTRLAIGAEMAARLSRSEDELRAGLRRSVEDCGLPSDIPRESPLSGLYSDCQQMVAGEMAEGRRRMCSAAFAQAGNPQTLRRARLTHPMLPSGITATVEDLICDPSYVNGFVTVSLTPTRSWFWSGYELSVDHGDVVITGRLVEDSAIQGAWTITHVNMPNIHREAKQSNDLGCFFEPETCVAER